MSNKFKKIISLVAFVVSLIVILQSEKIISINISALISSIPKFSVWVCSNICSIYVGVSLTDKTKKEKGL